MATEELVPQVLQAPGQRQMANRLALLAATAVRKLAAHSSSSVQLLEVVPWLHVHPPHRLEMLIPAPQQGLKAVQQVQKPWQGPSTHRGKHVQRRAPHGALRMAQNQQLCMQH